MINRLVSLLVTLLLFVSCDNKAEVSVVNLSEMDRQDELVEGCLCSFKKVDPAKLVVLDSTGKQVPLQLLYKGEVEPQAFVFPVSVKAGHKAVFTVTEGVPVKPAVKTFVRHVPERKDDIAWENDRIAFRVYGPALVAENPSNGIDVWYKRTSNLVIDKWYSNEISGKASYHDDNGEGLDCYKVGQTLGAGAIAPYSEGRIWAFKHYDRYKILDNGAFRSSFMLYYDSLLYDSHVLTAEVQISLDAGSFLNEITVRFSGDTTQLRLAAGINIQDASYVLNGNPERGYVGYAGNTISQGKQPVPSGRGYVGLVFLNRLAEVKVVNNQIACISHYMQGESFRYFAGAGWSKGGFASDQAWFDYLSNQQKAKSNPLEVSIIR